MRTTAIAKASSRLNPFNVLDVNLAQAEQARVGCDLGLDPFLREFRILFQHQPPVLDVLDRHRATSWRE